MKCWIVPSSLFVPGRLMAPIRLTKEKERLEERKKRLEAELKNLPDRIAEVDAELREIGEEYVPFRAMEKS